MMKLRKLLFVFNAHAGKGRIKSQLCNIIDIFIKGGYEVTTYVTQYPKHAKEIIMEYADQYDLIVCSGGDGTLNETVSGLMKLNAKIPVGYIPAGTTNDFAASIELPKDMRKCAETIVHGSTVLLDVGSFNDDYFVYIAAFGAFTGVSYQTPQETKNVLGHQAYILEGIKNLTSIKPQRLRIKTETQDLDKDFIFGMITNATSVGGFKGLPGKDVGLSDGVFEVLLVESPENAIDYPGIISALLFQNMESKYVHAFKASNIEVSSILPVRWVCDGEFAGELEAITIQNCHHALPFVVKPTHNEL